MADATINFDLLARDRASDKFTKVGKSAEGASSKIAKLGKVAKLGGLAVAAGAVGLGLFGKSAIKSASDAQQSFGASQAVFGKYAKTVIQQSRKAAEAYGLSANDYRESSNLIGSLLKNQGVAQDQLAGKTQNLVKLGADLSATYGGTAKDAVEALGAAFKGEFDPLEAYGVSLKQSTINTEAYALANVKGQSAFQKLSIAQQRAYTQQATTKILMKQTADAQGQFAKQTDTLAEKQQILGAKFENVKAKVGSALLPAVAGFVGFLSDKVLPAMDTASGKVKEFFKTKGNAALKKAVDGIKTAAEGIATAFGNAKDAAGKVKDALGGLDLSHMDGNQIGKALGDAVLSGLQRLGQLAGKIGQVLGGLFAKVDWVGLGISIGKQAPALILGLAAGLINFDMASTFRGIAAHWQEILLAVIVIALAPAKFIGPIARVLEKIPFVGKFMAVALRWINSLGGKLKSFGGDLLSSFWRGFMSRPIPGASFVTKVIRAVAGLPGALMSFWRNIATHLGVWALDAFEAAGRGARTGIGKLIKFAGSIAGRVLRAVGNLASLLFSAGQDIIRGLINGVSSMAGALTSKMTGIAKGALNAAKGALGIHSPSRKFHEVGQNVMQGLLNGLKSKWMPVKDYLAKVTDQVKAAGENLQNLMTQRNEMANGFRGFSSSIFGRDTGTDADGNANPDSVSGILAFAAKQQQEAAALARNVQRLVSMGLSKDLLAQLRDQGSSGIAQINTLAASATRGDIARLNASNKATAAYDTQAGMSVANALLGSDIARARAQEAQAKAIAKAVEHAVHGALKDLKIEGVVKGNDLYVLIQREQKRQHGKTNI